MTWRRCVAHALTIVGAAFLFFGFQVVVIAWKVGLEAGRPVPNYFGFVIVLSVSWIVLLVAYGFLLRGLERWS